MGKDIGRFYRHSQSQLSTPSIKKTTLSSLAYQTSSSVKSTITYLSYIIDKEKTDSVLCSQNSIHNYLNITNNYDIKSCETPRKTLQHSNHLYSKTSCATNQYPCTNECSA